MAGSASDIALASNAMLLLGGSTIASFTEESAESEIASNLFEHSYKFILSLYRWRFAVKTIQLSRLSAQPDNLYNYQFQLPSDMIYLIRPIGIKNYEIFEDKLYANELEVDIEYTYNIASDKVPSYFAKAFEFYLASQFAIPLTGDLNKAGHYSNEFDKALIKAKYADSSQRPARPFIDNRYTDVRNARGRR